MLNALAFAKGSLPFDWPVMVERGPKIHEGAVAAFETELGVQLPADYRAFLLECNGGRTALSHRVFSIRRSATQTDGAVLDSLHGIDARDAQGDLFVQRAHGRARLPAHLLAIGYEGLGGGDRPRDRWTDARAGMASPGEVGEVWTGRRVGMD